MSKEEKELELNYVKMMMIINKVYIKAVLQNSSLSPSQIHGVAIKEIEQYK